MRQRSVPRQAIKTVPSRRPNNKTAIEIMEIPFLSRIDAFTHIARNLFLVLSDIACVLLVGVVVAAWLFRVLIVHPVEKN